MARSIWMTQDCSEDDPLSRLLANGPHSLSDPELLVVLFGRGTQVAEIADNLLAAGGGLKALCQKDPQELCSVSGLSPRRAAQISAALELGRRVMRNGETRPVLASPEDIYDYLAPTLCGIPREQFRVLCFNSRNALVADVQVAQGSTTSCPVDPREVFQAAVLAKASGIVLAHNHPSGDPTPSVADLALTEQLVKGAALFCIKVLDHLVFGDWSFVSMARRGQLGGLSLERKELQWHSGGGSL